MEHFHYRNKCQIGHFFMNFHYARYENVKKSVPPKFKNEASDHLNGPVKDCVSQSYTDRFKTKRRFITKNANVAKLDSFIYCNP